MQVEVSVKCALGFVMYGVADESKLGEGVGIAVVAHGADQLGWQASSSSLNGHRCGDEERGAEGQKNAYKVDGSTDSESEGRRPQG